MAKFPKSKNGARKRAEHAEALADQVEGINAGTTYEAKVALAGEVAAMLMAPEPYTLSLDGGIFHLNTRGMGPDKIPFVLDNASWRPGVKFFGPSFLVAAISTVEHVFPGWGWDLIRWPKDATQIEGADGSFIHDAEITPYGSSLLGRDLIGQHKIMTCALWAAALRARAFQIRVEAGILEPLVNPLPLTPASRDVMAEPAPVLATPAEPEEQP